MPAAHSRGRPLDVGQSVGGFGVLLGRQFRRRILANRMAGEVPDRPAVWAVATDPSRADRPLASILASFR
jgi:hypothetical protein